MNFNTMQKTITIEAAWFLNFIVIYFFKENKKAPVNRPMPEHSIIKNPIQYIIFWIHPLHHITF